MMRLLLCLTERKGEVVSADELLNQVWPGVVVTSDSVYQAIASLRRLLGDDPKQPSYIVTVPRLGYRMVAPVAPWIDPVVAAPASSLLPAEAASDGVAAPRRRVGFLLGAGAAFALAAAFLWHDKLASGHTADLAAAAQYQKSIAVLPFLDLTEEMGQEYFADGMTEELIDRLSKIPGVRVPSPTSSFYFKGKQIPVAEIARKLGVNYVLDGSVRKSGATLRVAARLIRAENGFIIWSETYDRPLDDLLMVQDDIAAEVTNVLKATIDGSAESTTKIPPVIHAPAM
jgi:transcriptional activator of cad operon